MNPYEELGVPDDADEKVIKRAYRKKARESHPDHGGDAEQFKALAIAYDILTDEHKRAHFDRTGQTDHNSSELEMAVASMVAEAFEAQVANPIRYMEEKIDSMRAGFRSELEKTKSSVKRLRLRLKVFRDSNKGSESEAFALICNCLESDIKERERKVGFLTERIEFGTKILTYLNGLKFEGGERGSSPLTKVRFGNGVVFHTASGWGATS